MSWAGGRGNQMDFNAIEDSVLNLTESARLLAEDKKESERLLSEIKTIFKDIFGSLHFTSKKDTIQKQDVITEIFQKCTQLVASSDVLEYKTLVWFQNQFFFVYISDYWNPHLLNRILSHYYRQLLKCYWHVARERNRISFMMQVASIATQTESIKKLQTLFNRELWDIGDTIEKGILNKKKKENKKFKKEAI